MKVNDRHALARRRRCAGANQPLLLVALLAGLALSASLALAVRAAASPTAGAAIAAPIPALPEQVGQGSTPPVAVADVVTTSEHVAIPIDVLSNDTGDGLTVTMVSAPMSGTATTDGVMVHYTPTLHFNGVDTFDYTIVDGLGESASAPVTVTVTPVNDAPQAAGGTVSTAEDTPVAVDLAGLVSDVETADDLLTYTISGPYHGELGGIGPTFTYTPAPGYYGADSLSYFVTDRGDPDGCGEPSETCAAPLSSTVATIAISVNAPPELAPLGELVVDEQQVLTFTATALDPDVPPEVLTYTLNGAPEGAHIDPATGAFEWTPREDQGPGVYTFTVRVTDSGTPSLFDDEQVVVTVNEVNVAPVAEDDTAFASAGIPLTIDVLANDHDVEGDALTVTAVGTPLSGTATTDGATVTYLSALGFGRDFFTYTVGDGNGGFDTGNVTVYVAHRQHLPAVLCAPCDPYEPNDSLGQAWGPLISGEVYWAKLCPGDNDDLYFFDLSGPHPITVSLTNLPPGVDYDLYLYHGGADHKVGESRSSGSAGEQIVYNGSAGAGRYYVRVFPYLGRDDVQPYRLVVTY